MVADERLIESTMDCERKEKKKKMKGGGVSKVGVWHGQIENEVWNGQMRIQEEEKGDEVYSPNANDKSRVGASNG